MTALVITGSVGYFIGLTRPRSALGEPISAQPDNDEVRRLHDEDQADWAVEPVDWSAVVPRDRARRECVKALFSNRQLRTANDYYHSAIILQHGEVPEDFLLAHDFCVVAIAFGKNDKEARWLAASAEDRFLMNIGRPQRFATQFRSGAGGPMKLYPLRRLMGGNALEEAKAHEAELSKQPAAPMYSNADADVTPPVEVDRRMPPWNPPPDVRARSSIAGQSRS